MSLFTPKNDKTSTNIKKNDKTLFNLHQTPVENNFMDGFYLTFLNGTFFMVRAYTYKSIRVIRVI